RKGTLAAAQRGNDLEFVVVGLRPSRSPGHPANSSSYPQDSGSAHPGPHAYPPGRNPYPLNSAETDPSAGTAHTDSTPRWGKASLRWHTDYLHLC
ncbi:MAG: hypothetical protein Q8O76_00545, partial [Chloroflexota bacterium]|nr:hypothetical protein [Chloroflexota bacterium]